MKIALIQQPATPDRKENLKAALNRVQTAAEEGANLIAFAELAFSPFFPKERATGDVSGLAEPIPGPTTDIFMSKAKELGVVFVLNLFERDGDKTFDASPVIDSDGTLLGTTRMVHIADFENFYEKGYYAPGDRWTPVYNTSVGKIGVAICYDRHYPEVMRSLAIQGAELVVVPQAGTAGEWSPGLFEAEMRVASFQNGYYSALVNRVGTEGNMEFSGRSFITSPDGTVVARAPEGEDFILAAEVDLSTVDESPARRMFLRDRRPELY